MYVICSANQHVSLYMLIILHARSILLKDYDLIRLSINIEY